MTIRRMQNLGIAYMCLIITSCTFNNKQEKNKKKENINIAISTTGITGDNTA